MKKIVTSYEIVKCSIVITPIVVDAYDGRTAYTVRMDMEEKRRVKNETNEHNVE